VKIRSGLVQGAQDGDAIAYKGIPYAAPPIGPLRWKPPQPVSPWEDVRQATSFGPACPQPFMKGWSEDCLTINVWTPPTKGAGPLPVLVSIPGGGFYIGTSADPRVDLRPLVARGMIAVSFNYRLSVFGFFAHPALAKESASHVSGNYGLMDEIAALQWVHDNIGAFGGDPRNVTIAGNSAGGSSVVYLMLAPGARGLFARGIAQSAGFPYSPLAHRTEQRYGQAAREPSGEQLGGDLAELRALPAADLLARAKVRLYPWGPGTDYWPFVDGAVLRDEPWDLFDAGRFARVPLIIGTVTDEASIFTLVNSVKTADEWRTFLRRQAPGGENELEAAYPAATDADVRPAETRWFTDWAFHSPARSVARAVSAAGVPVYLYSFSRVPPIHPFPRETVGAFHMAEVDYLSTVPLRTGPSDSAGYEAADRVLAKTMNDFWARFVITGDPNGPGLPAWPRYQRATDQHLEFGTEITTGTGLHAQSSNRIDSIFAKMRQPQR
jgi:para-nitrobenzyl esterase